MDDFSMIEDKSNAEFSHSYSVLLPVYKNDSPEPLIRAIDSMLRQTVSPDEIFIAIDGSIDENLKNILNNYISFYPEKFSISQSENNVGLAATLRRTVPLCRNEWIARMDADDYSLPNRIEKQFEILKKHPEVDVVGCNVDEFLETTDNIKSRVRLPEKPTDVLRFAKRRCPIRHPTLLLKKSDIISVGNYDAAMVRQEDYDLIVRFLQSGRQVYNIQEPLVLMGVNKDFYKRRGGFKFLCLIWRAKLKFLKSGFLCFHEFLLSFLAQASVCLLPNFIREMIYNKFLRN
jgi:glycosyltransferase involved in cell wall biosynthesis